MEKRDEWELVRPSALEGTDRSGNCRESVFDNQKKVFFSLPKEFWFDFAFPVGMARQVLSYRYTILIFDIIYATVTLYYSLSYRALFRGAHAGGVWFLSYFILTSMLMTVLPPLSIRLLRDIFTSEAVPALFMLAKQYDRYYHLRVSCFCYLNITGCFLMIIFSTLLDLSPFFSRKVVPWLIALIIPSGLALSILVAVMEGHRVLQCRFIASLSQPEGHISLSNFLPSDEKGADEDDCRCPLTPPSSPSPVLHSSARSSEEIAQHFTQLRSEYLTLYLASQAVSQRYGLVILLYVTALVMYSAYLIWLLRLVDDITLRDIVPYLSICGCGLIELTLCLTLVNEIGEQIKRELAKHVLLYSYDTSVRGVAEDASLLLACANKLTIDIPFRGGFSLKSRHTVVLLGPLFASIIPTIIEKSKSG
jgi:hypothetical protein